MMRCAGQMLRGTEQKNFYEFLPAAIEVERTPSSLASRMIMWLIILLFFVAVAWAYFGKIDIVAIAQGKVIPTESVKQIQSLKTARIKAIHVKEGQVIEAGAMLIELDAQQVKSELARIKAELEGVRQNVARLGLLKSFLSTVSASTGNPDGAESSINPQQQAQLIQEQAEIIAQLRSFETEHKKLKSERDVALAEIAKKQQIIPVLKECVDARFTLQKMSYGSKLQYLELKQELIENQQDFAVQQARFEQVQQSEQSIETQRELYLSEKLKRVQAELNALHVQSERLGQQQLKTSKRLEHFTLLSPIKGQVQELAVTTIDGVVQSA